MGSSGGSTNYRQPNIPTPPNVAGYGGSVPFTPNFVNFLGDTNIPSTGLTPDMLEQIDSGAYRQPGPPMPSSGGGEGDRGLLAQILAQLQGMQQPRRYGTGQQRQIGGGGRNAGYGSSGRGGNYGT